jgi:SAM-dependent methyltransferase
MLDFACGTGLMSRALAAHTARKVGVDISQGMVDSNFRIMLQGVPTEEMRSLVANLEGKEGELDDERLDVALVRGRSPGNTCNALRHRRRISVTVDDSDSVSDVPLGALVGPSRRDLAPQPYCTPHERSAGAPREQ